MEEARGDVMKIITISLRDLPLEAWLWCLHCNRFFQKRRLRRDFLGNRERCAFCEAAGFGVDIHVWDTFRRDDWPASPRELRHGLIAR
jgi:hypothetical protein